jgi:transposase, IS5 family
MSGQIVDASLVSAPKQRNADAEKKAIKEGRVPEERKAKPAKLRQKDRRALDAGLRARARLREDGTKHADIAIPVFGYKSLASIDRRHGFTRKWDVTVASRHDGRMLRRGLLDPTNTGTTVWADSAYRSQANEAFMERHGFRSQVRHCKAKKGRPMLPHIRRGNAGRSRVRAVVEHVFAHQKGPMGLCIRTIGITRARMKIGLANLTYNIRRLVFHERTALTA